MILAALVALLTLAPMWMAAAGEYRIFLVQPEAALVESWEFQVLQGAWEPIMAVAGSLDPSDVCLVGTFTLAVPGWVRARAWGVSGEPSEWSRPIPAPEPDVRLGLGLGLLLLCALRRPSLEPH